MNEPNEDFPRYIWYEVVSNCCGAPIIDSDICSKCKEHCDKEIISEED